MYIRVYVRDYLLIKLITASAIGICICTYSKTNLFAGDMSRKYALNTEIVNIE